MPSSRTAIVLTTVAAAAAAAAPAHADGLPLPVDESPNGVPAPDGAARYLAVTLRDRTAVIAQDPASGNVRSRVDLHGRFGIPLVAYDASAGGVSGDGRTLVLIRPRSGFPRADTTFAVLSVRPRLRLRGYVRLRGDFSYDALSPDGRDLFLINYLSRRDPTRYRVRVYDLGRGRLDPRPVVDPREPPDAMNGLPVTRAAGPGGRWAYTLYDGLGEHPFIHALDTRDRAAVCIDLKRAVFAKLDPRQLRLRVAAGGRRLDVRRNGVVLASVDTRTFRVGPPAAVAAAAPATRDSGRGFGAAALPWAPLAVALLAAAITVRRAVRRRSGRRRALA